VIDANLDCEARWSGLALPAAVRARISLYGALVSALAPVDHDDLEVWTPVAIDPARWLGRPLAFRTGVPPRADLRWADPEAKAANDRRLARTVSALPGSIVIERGEPLPVAAPVFRGAWVAKAVWSAAGRDRCRGDGPPATDLQTRIERLAACGAVVVEPWCERVLDLGTCAIVDAAGEVTAEPPHGLVVDGRGGFLGIDLAAPPLEPAERVRFDAWVGDAGRALARAGYAGPFAVDGFVYREPEGGRGLHVCEINARHSFGWIARALARSNAASRLGFGEPPPGATILIAPAADGVTAWCA